MTWRKREARFAFLGENPAFVEWGPNKVSLNHLARLDSVDASSGWRTLPAESDVAISRLNRRKVGE